MKLKDLFSMSVFIFILIISVYNFYINKSITELEFQGRLAFVYIGLCLEDIKKSLK